MAIIQCGNNHYYDSAKNIHCPYCEKLNEAVTADGNDIQEKNTEFVISSFSADGGTKTEMYGEMVADGDKTISIFSDEAQNQYTAGWLVCMSGPVKGKSYILHKGRNFAGRDMSMDIVLSDDLLLSREKHFSVVYEPKKNRFYLIAGTGRTYCNDNHLTGETEIFEGDRITAGESEYIFIPFCKEGRVW